jgi:sugar lactone lactonase YvrE
MWNSMPNTFSAVRASSTTHVLAEGPVWVAATSRLLWIDVERGEVFEGALDGDSVIQTERIDIGGKVGALADGDDGSLLVAANDRLVVVEPDGTRRDGPRILEGSALRANDGGVDPAGRFLIGTYHFDERPGQDTLQRLEFDGSLTLLDDDLSISNGLAWSPDGTLFYSTDTANQTIWVRDYDPSSGAYGERRRHLAIESGYPDGLTIDSRGYLWIAIWSGFEVRSFAPDGTPGDVVRVPVPDVSSVAFVGHDLDRLVITTSSRDLDAAGREKYPDAGALFLADVGVTGLPTTSWRSSALAHQHLI